MSQAGLHRDSSVLRDGLSKTVELDADVQRWVVHHDGLLEAVVLLGEMLAGWGAGYGRGYLRPAAGELEAVSGVALPACSADLDSDGDGTVGILDLLTLLANWGPCA